MADPHRRGESLDRDRGRSTAVRLIAAAAPRAQTGRAPGDKVQSWNGALILTLLPSTTDQRPFADDSLLFGMLVAGARNHLYQTFMAYVRPMDALLGAEPGCDGKLDTPLLTGD